MCVPALCSVVHHLHLLIFCDGVAVHRYGWNSQYMGVINTVPGSSDGDPVLVCQNVGAGNEVQTNICYDNYNHPGLRIDTLLSLVTLAVCVC